MSENFENLSGSLGLIGCEIIHIDQTTSTMEDAWGLVITGAPEGAVVIADVQSDGRGRHGRKWVSKKSHDILCSVILRPRVSLASELLMVAALAVTDVANSYGLKSGIKWPNDIQVSGKKLAGVIAESKTGPDIAAENSIPVVADTVHLDHITAVIGIGLNVNFDPSTETHSAPFATSLASELGANLDRSEVFQKLLIALDAHYSKIIAGDTVLQLWRNQLTTLGHKVTVVSGNSVEKNTLVGTALDVDATGRLIVQDDYGKDWHVAAGEVTVTSIQ